MARWVVALLLGFAPAYGKTIETKTFADLEKHVTPGSLVLVGIDNTLITTQQQMGSQQWFIHQNARYRQAGLDPNQALEKALSEWEAVQNISPARLVEAQIPEVLARLQKKRIPLLGLSTRGLGLSTRTYYQLKSVGIDFTGAASTIKHLPLMLGEKLIAFRYGVLYTSGTHKGMALKKLLPLIHLKPQKIVYINDTLSQIEVMERSAKELKVPFEGLRYGFLDDEVKAFNPEIAEIQFKQFSQILTDQQATEALAKSKNPGVRPH